MLKIYHNKMCGKSRQTLELINNSGQEVEIIEYLKTPPSAEELQEILTKLNMQPQQLIRRNEKLFKEQFADKQFSDEEWIKVMVANPILIERPIVIKGDRAVIGRPPEKVTELL